ncbi:MAG: nitroreductase family protein [Candidatus Peribacteria bacterium]|nr:MAG: nitroreductase family protein [Candidatus Peribacteria bacterium]
MIFTLISTIHMKTLSTHELLENLNRRYATKQFDTTKKVDEIELNAILDSFHLAASSSNIQPWGLVVVENPELRKQLQTHAYGQSQIVDASHLLVLCRRTQVDEAWVDAIIDETVATRGQQPSDLDGLKQMKMGIIGMLGDQLPCRAANQVSIAA